MLISVAAFTQSDTIAHFKSQFGKPGEGLDMMGVKPMLPSALHAASLTSKIIPLIDSPSPTLQVLGISSLVVQVCFATLPVPMFVPISLKLWVGFLCFAYRHLCCLCMMLPKEVIITTFCSAPLPFGDMLAPFL